MLYFSTFILFERVIKLSNGSGDHILSLKMSSRARLRVLFGPPRYKALSESDAVLSFLAEKALKRDKTDEERVKAIVDAFLVHYAYLGDQNAFTLLREKYEVASASVVRETLNRYGFHSNLTLSVNETIETLWARIWRGLKNYDLEKGNFYTWIVKIAENCVKSKLKEEREKGFDYLEENFLDDEDGGESRLDTIPDPAGLSPDECVTALFYQEDCFSTLFSECGYPWQLLCTGFRLLEATQKEIVAKYAEMPLDGILTELTVEFHSQSQRSPEEIESSFAELRQALKKPLVEVFPPKEKHYAKNFDTLLNARTGELLLKTFFGEKPEKNVSDWHARAMGRLKKCLSEEGPAEN